uniref:Polyketide synthase n=1 Tax=Sorangium cellulosum TaxID=56 RepID=I0J6Y7_SORCE|nr:polyketide synthase [Sorangium cellulosum]
MTDKMDGDSQDLLKSALVKIKHLKAKLKESDARSFEPVAIVGMSCRFPGGGAGPEAFWRALSEGVDGVKRIPAERWSAEEVGSKRPEARWAGLLDGLDGFDAGFFGISPREACRLDPQQRLLLEVVWEALESAGARSEALLGSRTGVFLGMSNLDYQQLVREAGELDVYSGTGNASSTAAGRISYVLGLEGPCMSVDTACSSSLVAVHLACQSLRSRESDLAITGGACVILDPEIMTMIAETDALSPDGRCKTFDARANGFVRGEGCGAVVLKRLSDAERDGDPIVAVIRGSAVNQDGRSTGLTAPNMLAQQALLRQALESARVAASDIGYVETHGTGTPLGDPIEFEALRAVLGAPRADGARCVLGALKTNVGHLEAASGVAGLIKAALCLQRGMIPKNLHFQRLNPRMSLEGTPFVIPTENVPWEQSGKPRVAGVSSFGISGTNAHVVLEEAPRADRRGAGRPERSSHLLPLSARSAEGLVALAGAYQERLRKAGGSGLSLHDVAYTAGARRSHHEHRLCVVGGSAGAMAEALAAYARGEAPAGLLQGRAWSERPKVVFVFPGQGSQWVGMGRRSLREEPVFRAAIEACDAAIRREAGFSVVDELGAEEGTTRLGEIDVVQPVLFAMEVAFAALWRSWGVEPAAVVGHSMGEVAAAHVAGALTLEDAAAVICRRSRLLRRVSGKGAMALVELTMAEADKALQGVSDRLSVAVSNGPRSTVIAGEPSALEEVLSTLERDGVFCRRVKVDVASHSPQVDGLRSDLLEGLRGVSSREASLPMLSTVTGRPVRGGELAAGYWADNLRKPVLFSRVIRGLIEEGHTLFVEMSPHPILLPAIDENLHESKVEGATIASSRRQADERTSLLEALGKLYVHGYPVEWQRLYPDGGQVVDLPTYPWQRRRHWVEAGAKAREGSRAARRSARDLSAHPLLGAPFQSSLRLDERHWEQLLRVETTPYLADHRVLGEVVFPGAGYVEMALAAGAARLGDAALALEDVAFEQMLTLPAGGERIVQVALTQQGADRCAFQIASRGDDATAWTTHARGVVGRQRGEAGPERTVEGPEALKARLGARRSAAEHYQRMRAREIDYGPAFQGLVGLWVGEGEALGRVRLPEAVNDSGYTVHPALLDACLQVAAGLFSSSPEAETYLPTGVARAQVSARPPREAWVVVTRRADSEAVEGERSCDLRIVDDEGRSLVELTGLRGRRLEAPRREEQDALDGCVYEVAWRQAEPLPEPSFPRGGAWVVFSDQGDVGAGLHVRLSGAGQRCVRVFAGPGYERIEPDLYRIDPAKPGDYQRLLSEALGEEGLCQGVVHLFSLDAAPLEATTAETLSADLVRGSVSAAYLTQAIVRHGFRDAPRLFLVTRGAQAALEGEPVSVGQAPLLGLGRTMALEHPELKCTRIDLSATAAEGEAESVARELGARGREDQIALRREGRYVARLVGGALDRDGATDPGRRPAPPGVRADGSYLITGGLGGLGLSLARWLVEQGAKHLALVGRRGPGPEAQQAINAMEQAGARVLVESADVSRRDEVERLFARVEEKLPPLCGIVHAAAVLDDHTLLEQSEESFRKVFGPKALGAWHLHALSEGRALDFFVMYSSASALFGAPGQGNYTAANAFVDALSHERARRGLASMSIQWGAFAEVGLAAAHERRGKQLSHRGVASFTPAEGLEALRRLLLNPRAEVGVARFDVRQWIEFYLAAAGLPMFAELIAQRASARGDREAPRLRETLAEAAPHERLTLLERHLCEQAAIVLRLDPSQTDPRAPFQSLGMDSLMSLELRNRLEASLGLRLSAILLFTYPNPATLAGHLLAALYPSAAPLPEEPRRDPSRGDEREGLLAGVPMTEGETEAAIDAEIDALEDYLR